MATLNADNLAREMVPAVHTMLQTRIAEATDIVIKEAVAEFEAKLRRAIAETVMGLSSYYDVERMGSNVVITVKDARKR